MIGGFCKSGGSFEVNFRPIIVKMAPKINIENGSIDSIIANFLRFVNGILSILFCDKIPVKPKTFVVFGLHVYWLCTNHYFTRITMKKLLNALSKELLAGKIDNTKPILVDHFDGKIVFRNLGNKKE